MQAVRKELDRLRRGIARDVGTRRGARWHLGLLLLACALAIVNRLVVPIPVLSALDGRVVPVVIVGLGLAGLGPLLRVLATRASTLDPSRLASDLDDEHGWRDETSTAVQLDDATRERPVGGLLGAQTTGRLKSIRARTVGRPLDRRHVLRYALAFLFAFFFLAPGFRPLWPGPGPGGDNRSLIGPTGGGVGATALDADWFFATFVEDPLPVEALPELEPDDGADADSGDDR